jgi:hypothetical protein
MATFISLPPELQREVAKWLNMQSKRNLRLTCSRLCEAASPSLFHTMVFHLDSGAAAQGKEREEKEALLREVEVVRQLATRPDLTRHINRLRLYAKDHRVLMTDYLKTIFELDLRSVRSVSIDFGSRSWLVTGNRWHKLIESIVDHGLSSLQGSLRELTIYDTQYFSTRDGLVAGKQLTPLLQKLRSLRLRVSYAAYPHEGYDPLQDVRLHRFAADLRPYWIEPARLNLTRLAIYMRKPWGYMPKVDLRDLYLPHLRVLELGFWMISHDWQTDWIINHAATLETIWMDNCSMLVEARSPKLLDAEGYPCGITEDGDEAPPVESRGLRLQYVYNRRWRDVFDRFAAELPRLCDFRFGSTNERHRPPVDDLEEVVRQLPDNFVKEWWQMAKVERYLCFDGMGGRDYWRGELWKVNDPELMARLREQGRFLGQPKFLKEDKSSLVRLLNKLSQPIPKACHNLRD